MQVIITYGLCSQVIQFKLNSTVADLKEWIQDQYHKQEIQSSNLLINVVGNTYSYANLKDDLSLSELIMYQKDKQFKRYRIILSHRNIGGGGPVSFQFNSLTDKVSYFFSSSAPKWRLIDKGLNLEAKCKTPSCQAYGKMVWVQKKYGLFNMSKEVTACKCPICKMNTKHSTNLCIFMAKIEIRGMLKDSDKEVEDTYQSEDSNKFLTFKGNPETTANWQWMELEVTKI